MAAATKNISPRSLRWLSHVVDSHTDKHKSCLNFSYGALKCNIEEKSCQDSDAITNSFDKDMFLCLR